MPSESLGAKVRASNPALDAVVKGRFELGKHHWRCLTLVPTASFLVLTPMCQRKDNPMKFTRRSAVTMGLEPKCEGSRSLRGAGYRSMWMGTNAAGEELERSFRIERELLSRSIEGSHAGMDPRVVRPPGPSPSCTVGGRAICNCLCQTRLPPTSRTDRVLPPPTS